MLIDHTGAIFYPEHFHFSFRVIGRLAYPIFVYLVAEGFRYTKSPEKFLLRLFIFALISEPSFDWALNRTYAFDSELNIIYTTWAVDFLNNTNIFYTLFLGGAAITIFKRLTKTHTDEKPSINPLSMGAFAVLSCAGFMLLAHWLSADYGGAGVLFIFCMYALANTRNDMKIPRLAVMALFSLWQFNWMFLRLFDGRAYQVPLIQWLMIPAALLTIPLISIYNGQRGPSLKWFFYAAYPIHLAILAMAAHIILL